MLDEKSQKISLNGNWQVSGKIEQKGQGEQVLDAEVPGCVHMDLLRHELIPDIHYRDNETHTYWVYEQDWNYHRDFELTEAQVAASTLLLRCHGIDTLATIFVNDQEIAQCNNMHRTWDIDLSGTVYAGTNTIRVYFPCILPFLKEQHEKKHVPAWNIFKEEFWGNASLRKMHCSFGWDWGPIAPSVGIWRDIEIMCSQHARLDTVLIEQAHGDNMVTLDCTLPILDAQGDTYTAELSVSLDGQQVVQETVDIQKDTGRIRCEIANPSLWWPLGLGEQTLYDCVITLRNAAGKICDTQSLRIGLRDLQLIRENDDAGQTFTFRVNGHDIFAKGANWIPVHNYLPSITREHYRARLQDAADAHMNMLRVWGGGIYEDDNFYDLCDEMGILVWQDFMFACSGYPFAEEDLRANIAEEFRDNIQRLRHHACIALWCGNNELEQGLAADEWTEATMSWDDYDLVFNDLLPKICHELDAQRPYWPGSPHATIGDRNNADDERSGDCHLWSVWFGGKPFEAQREWTCRFMSEFGFQSFPEPKTLRGFTEEKDRNLSSYVMDFHQRSGMGNKTIFAYIMDWFLLPKNLDETLWLSQISHGLCVKYATEHLRRLQPHNMGVLYWQINDIWPCASWASVDYHGRWKALHYMAKQFFAPMLVTILENIEAWTFDLHISNHHLQTQTGTLHWSITDTSGKQLQAGEEAYSAAAQANTELTHINCSQLQASHKNRDILCWAWIECDGVVISRNCSHICKPKHLTLQEPMIECQFEHLPNGHIAAVLSSNVSALWTRLECEKEDIRWSDNFISLDGTQSVRIESAHPVTLQDPQKDIVVTSLYHSAWD